MGGITYKTAGGRYYRSGPNAPGRRIPAQGTATRNVIRFSRQDTWEQVFFYAQRKAHELHRRPWLLLVTNIEQRCLQISWPNFVRIQKKNIDFKNSDRNSFYYAPECVLRAMKLQLTDGMLCELPVPNFTKTGQLMRKVEVQIHLRRLVKCRFSRNSLFSNYM